MHSRRDVEILPRSRGLFSLKEERFGNGVMGKVVAPICRSLFPSPRMEILWILAFVLWETGVTPTSIQYTYM